MREPRVSQSVCPVLCVWMSQLALISCCHIVALSDVNSISYVKRCVLCRALYKCQILLLLLLLYAHKKFKKSANICNIWLLWNFSRNYFKLHIFQQNPFHIPFRASFILIYLLFWRKNRFKKVTNENTVLRTPFADFTYVKSDVNKTLQICSQKPFLYDVGKLHIHWMMQCWVRASQTWI